MPSLSAFFLTILPFLTSSLVGAWIIQNENLIANFHIYEWVLVCIGCALACAVALIPPTLLAFGFGYFLGWKAIVPLVLLNLMAIGLVYIFVRQLDTDVLLEKVKQYPKVAKVLNRVHKDEFTFVFFTKLSPVLPFALTNLVFALMKVKFKNIMLGGFLGMIPRTVLAVWVGLEAQEIRQLIENPNQNATNKLWVIALVVVSVVGLLRLFVKPKD